MKHLSRIFILLFTLFFSSLYADQEYFWRPTERWRGFNLLGMYIDQGQEPSFQEWDFQQIHQLGFNFVRLPLSYHFWIQNKDWKKINKNRVRIIDQAIAWGQKYDLHVQLCFHRAPGYTVAYPPEKKDLFTDPEAQRICAMHWTFFAKRYRSIPNDRLSFNLLNEPPSTLSDERYTAITTLLIQAIHKEDPKRFIIADGLSLGLRPARGLFPQKQLIGQAMRGYQPISLSHYLAPWMNLPNQRPQWPPSPTTSPLYGMTKSPWNTPLILQNPPLGKWEIRFGKISSLAHFVADADGQRIVDHTFHPKIGEGWTNTVFRQQWNIYQGEPTTPLIFFIDHKYDELKLSILEGDWANIRSIHILTPQGKETSQTFTDHWGQPNRKPFQFYSWNSTVAFRDLTISPHLGRTFILKQMLEPWAPARKENVFTYVGEFGAFNKTPHSIVLNWMEDQLQVWKEKNVGWALWNFRGPFGILDSDRADVKYENYHGHKLDRKMLQLLQKY